MNASRLPVFSPIRLSRFALPLTVGAAVSVAASLAACGGTPPAQTPVSTANDTAPTPSTSAAPATAVSSTTTTTTTTTTGKPKFDPSAPYDDPDEFTGTKTLSPLLSKSTSASAFPAKTVDEGQCWSTVNLSGKHLDDYTALTVACGPPGGLLPYVNPANGKLHSVRDQSDVYSVKLAAGFCYRYFAVADESIRDIDILVEKPGGAIVADDKQDAPVAIIEAQKSWCMDSDETYEFHVKIDGEGTGGYTFGIWARPKAKADH